MRLHYVLFFLFISNLQFGQTNSLLWEIKHPQTDQLSYVFGTIHLIPESHFFISDSLHHCLNIVDEIYFEINLDELNDISTWSSFINKLFMPNGVLLSQLTSPKDFNLITEKMKQANIPLYMFNRIKPMFLSILLETSNLDVSEKDSFQTMASYEFELSRIAKQNGTRISGLETIDFQVSLFDSISLEEQAQLLVSSLSDNKQESLNIDLYEIYSNQDLEKLTELLFSDSTHQNYNHLLLDKRNKKWIEQILSNSRKKSCVYAVGAGHLPGENGILNLLVQNGFIIRPMENF